MLNKSNTPRPPIRRRQGGVVIILVMIVLLAMTLGGLALMRSMDTSNLIAGNMAFQQAATQAADTGVEAAVAWLETNNVGGGLDNNVPSLGYTASAVNMTSTQVGGAFWSALSASGVCKRNAAGGCGTSDYYDPNKGGNAVSYMIQRLCDGAGSSTSTVCAIPQVAAGGQGNSGGVDDVSLTRVTAVLYRITVRVDGPRNTMSYVQVLVSL
jgi:type IV pilus assembly protein PilX